MPKKEDAILTRIPDPTVARRITYHTSNHYRSGPTPGAVSISLGDPRGSTVRRYINPITKEPILAPSAKLLSDWHHRATNGLTEAEYTKRFVQETLSKLDPLDVLNDLKRFAGPDGRVIMLCWENPGEFCHRRIVAKWITGITGVPVTEI